MSLTTRNNPAIERMRPLGPLFGATDKELAHVDRLTYEFAAPAGTVVIAEGDDPRGFFLIVSGHVEMTVAGVPCGELGPGMFFGETAMLDRGPEPATVTAVAPSILRVASRREFRELIHSSRVRYAMFLTFAARQRMALSTARLGSDARVTTDAQAPNPTEVVRT